MPILQSHQKWFNHQQKIAVDNLVIVANDFKFGSWPKALFKRSFLTNEV